MAIEGDPEHIQLAMQIIVHAGVAKTEAYEALRCARENDLEGIAEHLEKSELEMAEGHKVQTQLLTQEAAGNTIPFSMIMVHAQDTFMTTLSECNLIEELIGLYRRLSEIHAS